MNAREVREAVVMFTNGLMCALAFWYLIDVDGYGAARLWRVLAAASSAGAYELGRLAIQAEAKYWEAVRE